MNPGAKLRGLFEDPVIRQMAAQGVSALAIKVGAAGLSFLMFVAIANALSPAEYGRFGFGFSLSITLATIAGLGLGTAVLRYLPQYEAQKQPDLAVGFVRWATTTTVAVPLALGLAVALITFALHASGHIERPAYLYATAALVPITAIGEFFANLLRAEGFTFASMAPRDIFWRAAVALWALVLVVTGLQSSGAGMLSMAGALLLAIVVIQLAYARARITPLLSQGPGRQERRQWMATIAPMWGVATLYALVQQFDVVILGLFLSPDVAGPYFAALRTATLLSLLLIAGNLISAPLISKYHHRGDHAGLQRMVHLLTAGIALPTLAGYGLLVLIGGFLLRIFDPSFGSAYPLLLILGAGFAFDAIAGPTGYMLQMVGLEKLYLRIMATAYALTFALQCLLIPWFGAYGAAVPNALGIVLANILIIRAVKRHIGIDPSLLGLMRRRRG